MTEQQLAAMRQALEALESFAPHNGVFWRNLHKDDAEIANAITALRTAIAEAESRASEQAETAPMQEPVSRTDRQIVDQTEELALWLLSWGFNRQPETDTPMRESAHPMAKRCWSAACHIQEMLTNTDPENSVAELDVDDTPPAAPVQEPVRRRTTREEKIVRPGIYEVMRDVLSTTPPAAQRQWVGLTDEEMEKISVENGMATFLNDGEETHILWFDGDCFALLKAAEAKLKEKNGF